MPHNLSLVAEDPLTTISMPDNGDDLDAAAVETIVQLLGNKSVLHRTAFLGHIAWTERMSVAPGGSLTSFSINVGGILRVVGDDSNGVRRATGAAATTITQTAIEGGGGTLGASARWWYVYAFLTTSGTVDYAISLTGPAAYGRTKDGDTTRVYLGCFRTLASGAPLPMQKAGGLCLYRASALGSNELRVVSASSATGATAQSLAALVPPHGRLARLALAATGDGSQAALSIFYPGDTAAKSATCYAATGFSNEVHADVPTDASQVVDWNLTGSGSPAAAVHVHGFHE